MASAISSLTGSTSAADTMSAASASAVAPSKELFLQLLVAQIKNQDPLNPADGTQFVSELAQFSQLEQVIAIRQGVDEINAGTTGDSQTGVSQQTSN